MQNLDSNSEEAVDVDDSNFGTSETKSNFKPFEKVNYFQFKNGVNVYRIMPPMFSCLEQGHYAKYYSRHWGYFDENGRQKSFNCLKKYDDTTRELVEECPFCTDQENKFQSKKAAEALVATLTDKINKAQSQGASREDLTEEIDELQSAKEDLLVANKQYSPRQQRFWVNAMNLQGEFGLLALPKTVYEALVGKRDQDQKTGKFVRGTGQIQKVKEKEKIDPLGVNEGVFWAIERTGSGQFDTEYTVGPFKAERQLDDGTVVEVSKRAPLSAEQKQLALKKCKDLNTVFNHLFLTKEQAEAVVNGSPSAVNAVNNAPRKVETSESKTQSENTFNRKVPEWNPSDAELLKKFTTTTK